MHICAVLRSLRTAIQFICLDKGVYVYIAEIKMRGCFFYLKGTNIELGVKAESDNICECSFRRGRVFRAFGRKNKSTEVCPGDAYRLIRQDVPSELLRSRVNLDYACEFMDVDAVVLRRELEWGPTRVSDPAYIVERRRTRLNGVNVWLYRYERRARSWSFLSGKVLYVHGLRQLCFPVSSVCDDIVTFNTLPVLRAHVGVCRLECTKEHLGCRANRVSLPFYRRSMSLFGSSEEFNGGWLYGTCMYLQCVLNDDGWSLCVVNRAPYSPLMWVPNELVCTCTTLSPIPDDLDEHWYYTGRVVYLHGLPRAWYECDGSSELLRVYPEGGVGEVFGDGSVVVSSSVLCSDVRWVLTPRQKKLKYDFEMDIVRRVDNRLSQCFY